MQCAMCGREITNPDANYCDYCGTAIGTMTYREEVKEPQKVSEPKEERVSTWLLFGVMCLPMIPLVGGIAYLVILFYWAFAASVEDSRKSFARATLLYTAVTLVLGMILLGSFFALIMNTMSGVL
ncbi:MAG: zinc ribbon domain-containing protein [Lachnospiraceae bacterium]|nr:zinc ribbon domain-containing protein [Lachnospiraceae bacterium]